MIIYDRFSLSMVPLYKNMYFFTLVPVDARRYKLLEMIQTCFLRKKTNFQDNIYVKFSVAKHSLINRKIGSKFSITKSVIPKCSFFNIDSM